VAYDRNKVILKQFFFTSVTLGDSFQKTFFVQLEL